jgi:hypothetical protein
MARLYENEKEAEEHSIAIEGLSRTHGVGPDDVRSLYESVLAQMKRDAVIMDFLPIFAARKVREILRLTGAAGASDDPAL